MRHAQFQPLRGRHPADELKALNYDDRQCGAGLSCAAAAAWHLLDCHCPEAIDHWPARLLEKCGGATTVTIGFIRSSLVRARSRRMIEDRSAERGLRCLNIPDLGLEHAFGRSACTQ